MPLVGYNFSYPVCCADELPGGAFLLQGDIYGTAFSLGGAWMLTAGHVAKSIQAGSGRCGVVGLFGPDGAFKGARVEDVEHLDADLALLRLEFVVPESAKWFHTFKWSRRQLVGLEVARSIGYAHGMHDVDGKKTIITRAFQGYVVAHLGEFKPIGIDCPPFPVYELSFNAPRGLSGAPLLSANGPVLIHGIVIGNSEARMLVLSSEEHITEPAKTTIVEQYESLRLGIAVDAACALAQASRMLGKSLGEHLAEQQLVTD